MRWQIGICGDEHMGIKLGNICRFQSGGTPAKGRPEFFNGTIPWITTTALNGGNIGKESAVDWICEQAIKESAAKIVPAFSIMVGTRVGVGKVAINTISMSTSQDIVSLLDIDESIWSKAFLCKFLQAKGAFLNAQARGATIKGIKIDVLSELELPEIPIEEQQHISQIIDKVKTTIAMRQSQLQKLDKLVKARFIELFGDPLGNDKGWQKALIAEVCNAIFGGGTPSKSHPEYFAGSIPWVSPKDMKFSVINDSIDHITEDAIAHSTTNLVPANSVLMVIRSGILKHTLPVAINSLPVTINQDMKAFVPNETVKTAFLLYFFKAIENDVLAGVRGVTADNIDFKAFQKRTIIVPPLALQEQFVAFVTQTDKSKVAVQKALDEAQLLFDSLMQKYFG